MNENRLISDLLTETRPVISVEFFPPKDEEGGKRILDVAQDIQDEVQPDFVSITYGAGGTTRERTFRYAKILKEQYNFQVMPHLTCVGSSCEELEEIVKDYDQSGFRNIMALRGDPPKGENDFKPHPDGLAYASDLVALIKAKFPQFNLGVAGYPEVHPEAPSPEIDLKHLKLKVEQGASFITTQLFYDNEVFYKFCDSCRKIGITVPIIPGLMPIKSADQARRFCKSIPKELNKALDDANEDPLKIQRISENWIYHQTTDLLRNGFNGVHFYIMNQSKALLNLVNRLKADGFIKK